MSDPDDDRLEPTDPESEACFSALVAAIDWELSARIAVGDDPRTPEGSLALSELIADTVLDRFVVRERTERRYRSTKSK